MISEPITPQVTELATSDSFLPELIRAAVDDFIVQADNTPAICGTADQQASLMLLVVDGNRLIKVIKDERLKITKVLDDEKAKWMQRERDLTGPIDAAMLKIKKVVDHYNHEQMLQRQRDEAAQRQAQQEEIKQKGESDWLVAAAPITAKPKGVQQVWVHQVIDASKVPAEYLMVDVAKVKAAIANGVRDIPGIEIKQETRTTFRA